jgi:anionic cell wall polymer biosynthesis LytR-Cps2A-Psr (LCP) family protein
VKKKKLDKSIFLLGLIILLIAGMIAAGYFYLRPDVLTAMLKKGNPLKIMFSIADGKQLEFIEVFLYHPIQKKGGIFFIPENLGTKIEKLDKMDRIGVLYEPGRIGPLKKKVEQLIGQDIPFYINLKRGNISRLVDLIEGIDIFISNPVDLRYDDELILLPSGSVTLDGDKVEDYIRYDDENEEERDEILRKQQFLQALLKKISEPATNEFLQKEDAFEYFYKYIDTNISKRDLRFFIQELSEFDTEHMYPARVEGNILLVEDEELLFPHKGDYLKRNVQQLLDTISSDVAFNDEALVVTLEILNGTDVTGLASRTASLYQGYGYDVINVANADSDKYSQTIILDRKGRIDAAKKVADLIGCTRVNTEIKSTQVESADITIILGKDFDGNRIRK